MSPLDHFTEEQRQIITAEIVKHRDEAYAKGLAEGRAQAGPDAIVNWLKNAAGSWTMRGGAAALALAVAGDVWPVVAELLAGRIDPQILALIGGLVIALRARSIGRQP